MFFLAFYLHSFSRFFHHGSFIWMIEEESRWGSDVMNMWQWIKWNVKKYLFINNKLVIREKKEGQEETLVFFMWTDPWGELCLLLEGGAAKVIKCLCKERSVWCIFSTCRSSETLAGGSSGWSFVDSSVPSLGLSFTSWADVMEEQRSFISSTSS